jgi:hypothetical protein
MQLVELQMVQVGVHPVERQQLLMGTVFSHDAILDHNDLVGVAQGAQTMGDSDDGAAGDQPFQGFDHQVFGFGVERRAILRIGRCPSVARPTGYTEQAAPFKGC